MFKQTTAKIAALIAAQTVLADSPAKLPINTDLDSLSRNSLPAHNLQVPSYDVRTETLLRASHHTYSYKHAFGAHNRQDGISHLAWESDSVHAEVSAEIDWRNSPYKLKLSYQQNFDGQGVMTDYDYIENELAARTTSDGELSDERAFTAMLSKLIYKNDQTGKRHFFELTLDLAESQRYAAENFIGFSKIVRYSDGPAIGPSIPRNYPDTKASPPLEFEYREISLLAGERHEKQVGADSIIYAREGFGYINRQSRDWHNWRGGGRVSDLSTHGAEIYFGAGLKIPLGKLVLEFFAEHTWGWSYGDFDQGASTENKSNHSNTIEDSSEFSAGILLRLP